MLRFEFEILGYPFRCYLCLCVWVKTKCPY